MKIILLILCVLLIGCATPSQRFAETAQQYGFTETTLQTPYFLHKIYANRQVTAGDQPVLHVYLDGDGTPLAGQNEPTQDPTARQPLILSLMAQDTHAAILLGRPCYYGLSASKACESSLWTDRRYAPEIVGSLLEALNGFVGLHPFKKVVLIGYSGGGALAVLMAEKFPTVQAVVTVAANLDIDGWARHHRHGLLTGSLNPNLQPPLNKSITQLHLAGGKDENVPPYIIKNYVDNQQSIAKYLIYKDYAHQCCWAEAWGEILTLF